MIPILRIWHLFGILDRPSLFAIASLVVSCFILKLTDMTAAPLHWTLELHLSVLFA